MRRLRRATKEGAQLSRPSIWIAIAAASSEISIEIRDTHMPQTNHSKEHQQRTA
jgi:hypothetical protein